MDRATSPPPRPTPIPILTPSELAILVRLRDELAILESDIGRSRAEAPSTRALALRNERFCRRTARIEGYIDALLARTAHQ